MPRPADATTSPPRLSEWILRLLVPDDQRDALLGDAAEEHAKRLRRDGRRLAHRWYRRQACRSAVPLLADRARAHFSKQTRQGDGRMTNWRRDVGLALRTLGRRPLFTLTIVVTLAVGIGANTALFGVFRAVFLEPIPLPDSDELVVVMETAGFGCCGPASGPDYLDWVERERSFDGMAVLSPRSFNLTGLDEAQRVFGTHVSSSAFEFLGVQPLMGRALTAEDDAPDVPTVIVLSHSFWQNTLGSRPDVLNSTVHVDGLPLTVVGVMPPGFDVPSPWAGTRSHQVYVPFPHQDLVDRRGSHGYPVIARLRDGVPLETAQSDMERIMRELGEEYPATNAERSARVFTVHEYLYGDIGEKLLLILGSAALVLLIACGNVAALQMARASGREVELNVRTALGASRRTLVRLLFSESALLALLGGAVGVLVAFLALGGLRAVLPPTIPRIEAIRIDGWALLFATGASLLAAVAFGMLPALMASRTNLASGLKEGGYGTLAPRKERVRDYFIIVQIALGLVLVNGAALLVRSYAELRGLEQGFESEGVLTVQLNAGGPRYEDPLERLRFYERVTEQVRLVPGIRHAGVVSKLPLSGGSNGHIWVEGAPPRTTADEGPLVEVSSVSGDYFEAMGIPLVLGRALIPADSASESPGVVINRALAEEAWPDQDPIGKRFSFDDDPPRWFTVVGVVGNVRQWGLERPALGEAYFPYTEGWSSGAFVVAQAEGIPGTLSRELRAAILGVDGTQPPSNVQGMDDRVERAFAERRFYTTLIGLFALSALFLAAAGIYGTVSYFVAGRARELGIRMALGAGHPGIVRLVLIRAVRLAVLGILVGLLGVWATTSVVGSFVYGAGGFSYGMVLLGCVTLGSVAILASLIPARRAIAVPPSIALKAE